MRIRWLRSIFRSLILIAGVTLPDGSPRFVWTDTAPDPITYRQCCSTPSRNDTAGVLNTTPRRLGQAMPRVLWTVVRQPHLGLTR